MTDLVGSVRLLTAAMGVDLVFDTEGVESMAKCGDSRRVGRKGRSTSPDRRSGPESRRTIGDVVPRSAVHGRGALIILQMIDALNQG